IQKWLKAGVLEEGKHREMERGTIQGGSISPLLANIYLHFIAVLISFVSNKPAFDYPSDLDGFFVILKLDPPLCCPNYRNAKISWWSAGEICAGILKGWSSHPHRSR